MENELKNESRLSNAEYYSLLRETLGYDGIKANNKTNGEDGNYWIAFNSNQIKNIDNSNPTDNPDIRYSKTDLITPAEIYAPAIANGSTDNAYGIQIVGNMRSYVNTFPPQYRGNIEQLLADDELNYTCQ